jgi:hypothetical protein
LVGIFLATETSEWSRMGVARMACVRGCSCTPANMAIADIHHEGDHLWGKLATAQTEVRLQICRLAERVAPKLCQLALWALLLTYACSHACLLHCCQQCTLCSL